MLIRPQFAFLPFFLGGLVAYASLVIARSKPRVAIGRACLAAGPGLLLVLGWAFVNYALAGSFTLSTQLGFNLTNHSAPLVESASDRYSTIRDIVIKYRDAKIARDGRHSMAIWEARPELVARTGLSMPALSQELGRMSIELFLRHPFRYAVSVTRAWVSFWLAPNYWRLEKLTPPSLARAVEWLWRLEHPLVRLCNGAFLACAVLAVLSRGFRLRTGWGISLTSISMLILLASLVQALTEYGDNPRYAIPVQGLTIFVVLIAVYNWIGTLTRRRVEVEPLGWSDQYPRRVGM
jgi:hypothetical protein